MTEILEIFKSYNGTGYYCLLFLAAVLYLWFVEEDRHLKLILCVVPTIIQVLFFIPYFYMGYNSLDEGTYYRILWLMPMTLVIAYAACKVIGSYTKAGLIIVSIILVLSGTWVYSGINASRAESVYHIPDEVVEVCDMIKPAEGKERVWASFPISMIHYVRQYTTTIQMPFGRDNLVPGWDHIDNPLYDLYLQDVIDADALVSEATKYYCNYIILEKTQTIDGSLEALGANLVGTTQNYYVYRNTRVPFWDVETETETEN